MKSVPSTVPTVKDFASTGDYLGHQFVLWMLVGQLCALWQHLEVEIEKTIWRWAGLSKQRGACFTAHMQFPLRCDVLQSLAHIRFQNADYDKALTKLIQNRLKPAKAVRDRFAHAVWDPLDGKSNTIIEKPSRNSPKKFRTPISMFELLDGQLKVVDAGLAFAQILVEFQGGKFSPDAWPKKFVEPFFGYDQLLAARALSRAKRNKHPRPRRSSRA